MHSDIRNKRAATRGRNSQDRTAASGVGRLIQSALWGAGAFALCCSVLLLIGSILACRLPDPDALPDAIAAAVMLIGSLVGGWTCAKKQKEGSLVCGICTAAALLILLLILSLFLPGEEISAYKLPFSLPLHIAMVPASIAGAYGALRKKGTSRRRSSHKHNAKRKT